MSGFVTRYKADLYCAWTAGRKTQSFQALLGESSNGRLYDPPEYPIKSTRISPDDTRFCPVDDGCLYCAPFPRPAPSQVAG